MTFGSLFSGAGGFDLGLERAGLRCLWQCEIDLHASGVLARHWPDVKRFGDIRLVRKKDLDPVDVLAGGFPCQGLSVAGKRGGLRDERSGLFYEFVRVARLLGPGVVVWENVPGLLSNDGGRDFARVLRALADLGYFGAWRVLDAKFFGVPQRRRRVFGVFARGRAGALRAAQILALTQGVPGHPAAGGEAGEDVAYTLTGSVGRDRNGGRVGNAWNTTYVAGTLTARPKGKAGYNARDEAGLVPARCLTSRGQRNDGEADNLILDLGNANAQDEMGTLLAAQAKGNRGHAVCVTGDRTHALTGEGHDASEDGTGRGTPLVFNWNQTSPSVKTGPGPTIRAGAGGGSAMPAVCFQQNERDGVREMPEAGALAANHGVKQQEVLHHPSGVRRLTPRECERLMGWPDDWTRYDGDGNEFGDGPRYRMCGNGVVGPVAEWLGRRLNTNGG